MKKRIFSILLLVSIFLTGCVGKIDSYIEISYDDHEKMIADKENFILFIGSETCSACATYKDKIIPIVKEYQVKVYYIDLNKLSESERNHFNTYYNYSGTPTTLFVTEGKEQSTYNRISSADVSKDQIISIFKSNGYIKGD